MPLGDGPQFIPALHQPAQAPNQGGAGVASTDEIASPEVGGGTGPSGSSTLQWVNALDFGLVASGRPSLGGFDNTAAMTTLINAANAQRKLIYLPPQAKSYGFAASPPATDPLPTITACPGIIGGSEEAFTILEFDNTDGSCIKLRGTSDYTVRGMDIANYRTASLTNVSGVLDSANTAYSIYRHLGFAQGAPNNSGIYEHARYDLMSVALATGPIPNGNYTVGAVVATTASSQTVTLQGTATVVTLSQATWTSEQLQHARLEPLEVITIVGGVGGQAIRVWDAYLPAHIGLWYNVHEAIRATYLTVGANVGYGINIDATAFQGIVNPPGQTPGTYSKNFGQSTFKLLNIESQDRSINANFIDTTTFEAGQLLGSNDQYFFRNAKYCRAKDTHGNQWTRTALNFDSVSCLSNRFEGLTFFNVTPQPWQLGPDLTFTNTFGNNPNTDLNSDGIAWDGVYVRSGTYGDSSGATTLYALQYSGRFFWNVEGDAATYWAIGPRSDNSAIVALYAFPLVVNPAGPTNAILQAFPQGSNYAPRLNGGPGASVGTSMSGLDLETFVDWQGTEHQQQLTNAFRVPFRFNTTDNATHTVYKFPVPNGTAGAIARASVNWEARDNTHLDGTGSGGSMYTGVFANNGGGVVSAIGAPADVTGTKFGVNAISLVAGAGADQNKILVQFTAASADATDLQGEVVFSVN